MLQMFVQVQGDNPRLLTTSIDSTVQALKERVIIQRPWLQLDPKHFEVRHGRKKLDDSSLIKDCGLEDNTRVDVVECSAVPTVIETLRTMTIDALDEVRKWIEQQQSNLKAMEARESKTQDTPTAFAMPPHILIPTITRSPVVTDDEYVPLAVSPASGSGVSATGDTSSTSTTPPKTPTPDLSQSPIPKQPQKKKRAPTKRPNAKNATRPDVEQ